MRARRLVVRTVRIFLECCEIRGSISRSFRQSTAALKEASSTAVDSFTRHWLAVRRVGCCSSLGLVRGRGPLRAAIAPQQPLGPFLCALAGRSSLTTRPPVSRQLHVATWSGQFFFHSHHHKGPQNQNPKPKPRSKLQAPTRLCSLHGPRRSAERPAGASRSEPEEKSGPLRPAPLPPAPVRSGSEALAPR